MSAMRNLPVALVAVVLLAAVGLGCTAESEDAPLQPSYEHDIKPLMAAHCIRCHGAGGSLNLDPDATPVAPSGQPKVQMPKVGDFTDMAGLMPYVGKTYKLMMSSIETLPMPPPPSAPLTDREKEMFAAWLQVPLP
jgi:hypothetical protein